MINEIQAKYLWSNKEYLTKGKRGLIYISTLNNIKYIIKTKNPESHATNTIKKEYDNNKLLNAHDVGPKVYYYDECEDFVIREYVEGINFVEWMKTSPSKNKIQNLFFDLLDQCKRMDEAKINKLEMNHPHKDLLIKNDKPIIIDFERCKLTIKPKNVTQVCQFFISTAMTSLLKEINVEFNREKILELSERYKQEVKDESKEGEKEQKNKYLDELKNEIKKGF